MATPLEEIVGLYHERRTAYGPALTKMQDLTDAYNGDTAVPLPEMDKDEKVAVANLLATGLDQNAMRIASTMPAPFYPPERPGIDISERRADIRRKATLGWWNDSKLDIIMGRRARQFLGYATSPVRIRWDSERGVPTWRIGSPLWTFPAAGDNPDDMEPTDCIFAYRRTLGWLERHYSEAMAGLNKGESPSPDTAFDVIEYVDGDETVLAVIGRKAPPSPTASFDARWSVPGKPAAELERMVNRIGVCPAIVPGRITLDRRQGRFDGLIGLYQQQAKLMALEYIAVTEGVWPKTWLIARPNEMPEVVTEAEPRRGITGVVRGGELTQMQLQPGYMTTQTRDYLEGAIRSEGGIPAQMSGLTPTNVRTGRAGDSVLSNTIDYPIQEAQRVFERSLAAENRIAMAFAKTYGGSAKKSFYVGWRGSRSRVDYVATRDFTDFTNFVSFPQTGSDVNQLIVSVGQRLSLKLMSRATGRQLDPAIDDPDFEERQTAVEGINDALLASIQADVSNGTYTAVDVASMALKLETEPAMTLAQVIEEVQKAKQAAQAAPTAPGAPEAQPGLAPGPAGPGGAGNPGAVGPGGPGGIATPPNVSGLAGLLGALHAPAQMAGAPGGGQ